MTAVLLKVDTRFERTVTSALRVSRYALLVKTESAGRLHRPALSPNYRCSLRVTRNAQRVTPITTSARYPATYSE